MRIAIIVPLQLIVLFSAKFIRGYVFPDDFKICRSNDPNLNECLVVAIQDALLKLANPGIHSPINLTINNIYYPYFVITPDDSDRNTTIECFNLTFPNLWQIQVENVSMNLCNLTLEFMTYSSETTAFIPHYRILGKIDEYGKPEPVDGDGVAIMRYHNLTMKHSLKFRRADKHGENYLDLVSYAVRLSLSRARIFFGDLAEEDLHLGEDSLASFDQYGVTLEGEQKRRLEVFGGLTFRWFAGQLVGSVPMDRVVTGWSGSCGGQSAGRP